MEGAPESGVPPATGPHMSDGPPAKRVKRESDHLASYEQQEVPQQRNAGNQKKVCGLVFARLNETIAIRLLFCFPSLFLFGGWGGWGLVKGMRNKK